MSKPVRMKNRFGRRFIRPRELGGYAVDLDLRPDPPGETFFEFLEEHGMLAPVRRIALPPEIVRRLHKEHYPNDPVLDPVEPDGPRLDAAADLMNAIHMNRWANPAVFGESVHVLDALHPAHRPFIQTDFSPASFTPWDSHRVPISSQPVLRSNNNQYAPTFYHYWQIFFLATILRSGLHIYYPLDDKALGMAFLRGPFPADALQGRSHHFLNIEAFHELQSLREFEPHFEAAGYYQAYSHNALQLIAKHRDEHGRVPHKHWRTYLKREREIARETLRASQLSKADIVAFIGAQCEWWDNARRVGPAAVADDYKRNINASIGFLRAATGIKPREVIERVGRRTGDFKPALEVIFPDWTEEQRDLTIRSLKRWADKDLAALPPPFPCTEADLDAFCDWLEDRGLYQYYWHFRRLLDLERRDDPVHRAASTSEVVGFATLCELIANEVMIDRGLPPRGHVLEFKLRQIFDSSGPVDLSEFLKKRKNARQTIRFGQLANTRHQSLPRRLAQIARIRTGGPHSPVLRAMLSFMVIRNEGAHLGLLRFDHAMIIEMIRILSLASLMLWKAR